MPRFDIGPAAEFESRNGGIGTGGLVRNGFLEDDEGVWSWQRPALGFGQAAPFSGTALGMLVLGDTLYGVGVSSNGIASSFVVAVPQLTPFTINIGRIGTGSQDDVVAGYFEGAMGALNPSTWRSAVVSALVVGGPNQVLGTSVLSVYGTVSANHFTGVHLQGNTLYTAHASFSVVGGFSGWTWSSLLMGTSTGIHTGAFW